MPERRDMLNLLKLEDFQTRVGETFSTVLRGGNSFPLTLTKAAALPHGHPGATRAPFSLFFAAPAVTPLAQATWELTNETLGTLPIFIVPIRRDGDRLIYQAIFT